MSLYWVQYNAEAAQWLSLNGTSRYKVAYDEQSVRLTAPGRLEICFRFVPRGETERKSAAVAYSEKKYRSHLEYYEIACSEQASLLRSIEILGVSGVRLKRLPGNTQPEPILPGSVLDKAAQHICPSSEEDTGEENDPTEVGQTEGPDAKNDLTLSNEHRQQIEALRKSITLNEATAETWKKLGNIYFDADQPEQAIKAYEQALALQPGDTDVLNDQGAMYRQTGDFKRALANFEKAFSIDPHNLESLYNSGYVYAFDLNNTPKALVLWRRYLELESKSETARQVQSFIDQYGK